MAEWKTWGAYIDHHIEVDRHGITAFPMRWSVEQLEARFTAPWRFSIVENAWSRTCATSLPRHYHHSTVHEHMPQESSGSSGVDPLPVHSLGRERGRTRWP